jgi:hypothetical protein
VHGVTRRQDVALGLHDLAAVRDELDVACLRYCTATVPAFTVTVEMTATKLA